ncbi:hypothetical protein [Streptomyces sp. DH37]|uniref:hypothetical protein n=1 Tax=Streptomyces sp. DH37 TaxID=3040122 RepID=UPI002442229F|nr:hypothetical protein [Streptomyces sp. DH37]MDG9706272.1 hypothetical protein [Streptomyces sp. DH37]
MSAGYAAHFEGVTAEKLFALEDAEGDCDAPQNYVECLLVILASWRADLERWRARLDELPSAAVARYRDEAARYTEALNATREAWLQWSFRWEGGPALPERFDLPAAGGARR